MARKKGVEEDFRWLCALLEAPFDLRCLLLVAGNLKNAIDLVPENWALTEDFGPLRRAADWALANSSKLRTVIVQEESLSQKFYPLYAMMCHTCQVSEYFGIYQLLQLQVLSARGSVGWKQRVSAQCRRARSAVAAKGSLGERHT
jgi:hypothetical protein